MGKTALCKFHEVSRIRYGRWDLKITSKQRNDNFIVLAWWPWFHGLDGDWEQSR